MKTRTAAGTPRSAGITLTEILISILILGVGLVSLATLFPIGLLRLREAQRQTRSAYLFLAATADVASRGLLSSNSFAAADLLNFTAPTFPLWYPTALAAGNPLGTGPEYNPLVQDTAYYGTDPADNPNNNANPGVSAVTAGGYGLPFAYDPLWRYWTINPLNNNPLTNKGVYLDPFGRTAPEARFGAGTFATINNPAGVSFLRPDPMNDGFAPSAHGLQRLTNFNRASVMPSAAGIPSTFVSPEDLVWQEPTKMDYSMAFPALGGTVGTPSSVLPDLSLSLDNQGNPTTTNDWRFSWMLTAQQNNTANGAAFEGNIVIFENRPFSLDATTVGGNTLYLPAGETVVEAVYGASTSVASNPVQGQPGYGAGADRTVLLRWPATQPDPLVRVGDFFADVTYERNQNLVYSRFYFTPGSLPTSTNPAPPFLQNPLNSYEWDTLPAQRCFWYQVLKRTPAQPDQALGASYRSMTVYVNRPLEAKTLLGGTASPVGVGNPMVLNAALICPYVVNVIPQTFFVR